MWNISILIIALLVLNSETSAFFFNQPKFCSTASWNPNAITFANESIVGSYLSSVFVNTNNTIYVADWEYNIISVWHEDRINPAMIIPGNFTNPNSLFVTSNSDIYVDDGEENGRVQRWIAKTNTFVTLMKVNSSCYGLFVDRNDTLYCSMHDNHQVMKRSLNDGEMTSIIVVAGTGFEGSTSNQLDGPWGIFVDVNFDLYVADWGNHRVQLWHSGESYGITAAGLGSPNPTINLECPAAVVLDAEKYLFIADYNNNRVVGSGLNGFRCLVGCYGGGSQSNQLTYPSSLSFDRSGNMFVADMGNNRIQKFLYMEICAALSVNQPKFCPTASWNPYAITFANQSIVGSYPYSVFVNTNNTIYVANRENSTILVWHENSINPTMIISGNFANPSSLFVTSNDDIYIDDGEENGRVQKRIARRNDFVTVMKVNSSCYGLFVDRNDTLYCSMFAHHQVVKRSLNDTDMTSIIIVAGTGVQGLNFNQLGYPWGIFVDVNFDLYVADSGNDRIQLWHSGKSSGITVAGNGSLSPTISLYRPTLVVLDAEKYLFIVDYANHRVVGSGVNGFRCLVGCYEWGSRSNQLENPTSLSFDHSRNMFVADYVNSRIQKFIYLDKSCVYALLPVQNVYSSSLSASSQIYSRNCNKQNFYYESIQVKVTTSGYYSFRSYSAIDAYGSIYRKTFNPLNPSENLFQTEDDSYFDFQFRLDIYLTDDITYVLVMTQYQFKDTSAFWIVAMGDNKVILERLSTPVIIQLVYSSQLTVDSPTFYRDSKVPKCHYETFEINAMKNGLYVLWSESDNIHPYAYIYKNHFDALKPFENLLLQHDGFCNDEQFKLIIDLQINVRYVLVVTTHSPNTIGNFSIFISGAENVSFSHIDGCYVKAIGLTLDDILRDELRVNTTLNNQPFSIKISAVITMMSFVAGLFNSVLSLITFQSKDCQQVGCGMYLVASSVSSFLTISMSTVKFWFVVLTQINVSASLSVLRGGCLSIEVILKVFLYLDGWLNACVAIERAMHVFKGANFDKKKSKHFAGRIILVLPFCIIGSLFHELVYRRLFVYQTEPDKTSDEETTWRYVSCVTLYPAGIRDYNTAILFFHLVAPLVANFISALFIIFGGARQRSVTRTDQSFSGHVREQFSQHKQLLISPMILLILSLPRLVILLLPGCMKAKSSEYLWLYLSAYFISFIPSMLIFLIFVAPSEVYMKAFKQSLNTVRQRIRR